MTLAWRISKVRNNGVLIDHTPLTDALNKKYPDITHLNYLYNNRMITKRRYNYVAEKLKGADRGGRK